MEGSIRQSNERQKKTLACLIHGSKTRQKTTKNLRFSTISRCTRKPDFWGFSKPTKKSLGPPFFEPKKNPKNGQKRSKMAKNDQKTPKITKKFSLRGQKPQKIVKNDQKMAKNTYKYRQKSTFWVPEEAIFHKLVRFCSANGRGGSKNI